MGSRAVFLNSDLVVDVVEDNPQELELTKRVLQKAGLTARESFTSAEAAIQAYCSISQPGILLMDFNLPGMNGVEATAYLHQKFPDTDILMLTSFEGPELIMKAIKAGISGYVMKSSLVDDLVPALQEAGRGGSFLSGNVAREILSEVRKKQESKIEGFSLSPRESETLKMLALGYSYKQIADKLKLSVHTVNNHIRKVYKKLRVSSRHEAVAKTSSF